MTISHDVKVVHHIPGRLRVRLSQARRNPILLRELHDLVKGFGGVRQVEINPATGSILVHYDPETPEQINTLIRNRSGDNGVDLMPDLGGVEDMAENIQKEAEFLAAHSELARNVVNTVKALNQEVRVATGNAVDLKVLLPAGLAVWAFLKAGTEISTPLWVTLAIFSFNSFVALHSHTTLHVTSHEMAIDRPGETRRA